MEHESVIKEDLKAQDNLIEVKAPNVAKKFRHANSCFTTHFNLLPKN